MADDILFNRLVRYHIERNLPLYIGSIEEGVSSLIDMDEDIGYDYNAHPRSKRLLLVTNGDTLVEKLRKDQVMTDSKDPVFTDVPDYDGFAAFFDKTKGDGSYVYHKRAQRVGRVRELNTNPPGLVENLDNLIAMLPEDFVAYDGSVPTEEVGNKTRLAFKIPYAHPEFETYQIKGTVHSPLGLGIVTHFTKESMEMFYFEHDPMHTGDFVDPEKKIVGVYRRYQREGDNLVLKEMKTVNLDAKQNLVYKPLESNPGYKVA
ncbi:MAG: hypothetical protein KJ601_03620 [Nanoarchaeota archaeon]|nr:hypothetical protein [Nanoarchaeota archaeon]MBU1704730.1 hypothetical protein [Nanoarchaeota archaeon]